MNPLALAKLAWKFRKWAAYAIGGAVVAWALLAYRHSLIELGEARTQARWDADEAAEKAVADAAIQDNAKKEAAAAARNQEIEREYQNKLAAATADIERTYGLLRQARAAANRRAGEAATGATIAIAASEASVADRIDRAVAGVVAEHRANSDQLDALIAVVKPQM